MKENVKSFEVDLIFIDNLTRRLYNNISKSVVLHMTHVFNNFQILSSAKRLFCKD